MPTLSEVEFGADAYPTCGTFEKPNFAPESKFTMTKRTKSESKPTAPEPLELAENQKSAAALWGIPVPVQKLAKSQGCSAFKSGRVHRKPLLEWVKRHAAESEQAVSLDLAKANKQELELEKLRAQIRLLTSRDDREKRDLITMTEARSEWSRALAIGQEEAKGLMESDVYRVFCVRWKSRCGEVLPD